MAFTSRFAPPNLGERHSVSFENWVKSGGANLEVNESAQPMRMRWHVAGRSSAMKPLSSTSCSDLAALIAFRHANKADDAMKKGGSPTALEE